MDIFWNYKNNKEVLKTRWQEGVCYLSFQALDRLGIVKHGFSTRLGGVSEGVFASMNFSASKGDSPEHVRENFARMARALGVDQEKMTMSWQTHTTNVRLVTEEDLGKGVVKPRDYRDVDGLITNIPGAVLVTIYADCVPLYLVDPVRKAIGLSHSGWRGTVNRMGAVTVEQMQKSFGTNPKDLIACIGPSICQDCFEVGEEVALAFREAFQPRQEPEILKPGKSKDKFQLDLWRANQIILEEAGVPFSQIYTTNLCTKCNSRYLFSHRAMGEHRGNLGAFLSLV